MKIIKTLQAKTVKICLLAASLSVVSVPAFAQNESRGYVGVNYVALEYEIGRAEFDTPVLMINAGYQINPYIALEGRLGLGVGDDTVSGTFQNLPIPGVGPISGSTSLTTEVDNYFGGFVRVGYPVNQRFYPYAMLGYGQSKSTAGISTSTNIGSVSVSGSADDSDFAYGIGANIGFSDSLYGKVEYMNYYDEGIEKASGLTVGLEFKF